MTDTDATRQALDALFETWDSSSDVLGPEWSGIAERIEAVRAALASRGEPAGEMSEPPPERETAHRVTDQGGSLTSPLAAPDDWATVEAAIEAGAGAATECRWDDGDEFRAARLAIARLRADSHAKTEALERITKLTGYWAQVGQDAQRVARDALAAAAAAPKEPR